MPLIEIKDFNVLVNDKPFFEQLMKTNKKCLNILINFNYKKYNQKIRHVEYYDK